MYQHLYTFKAPRNYEEANNIYSDWGLQTVRMEDASPLYLVLVIWIISA
jgi:hypothetical protein